jgi:hypothetical protein
MVMNPGGGICEEQLIGTPEGSCPIFQNGLTEKGMKKWKEW